MVYYPYIHEFKKLSSILDSQRIEIERRKPYKFPKGYINYQIFLYLFVVSQLGLESNIQHKLDITDALFHFELSCWDRENIPIYGLSKETFKLFKDSKIDNNKDLFENLPISQTSRYCVLLPSGGFKTYDNNYIEFILIESVRNNSSEPQMSSKAIGEDQILDQINPYSQRIRVFAVDTAEQTYLAFSDYPSVSKGMKNVDGEDFDEPTREIIDSLDCLALQIVMAIEFLPETIEVSAPKEAISKGFGRKVAQESYWQIRQIKVEQKRYIIKSTSDNTSSEDIRRSPRPHWRKWHWRRVAVGKDRQGREWRLIPNTYINPDS
jgi:hypothetical protein